MADGDITVKVSFSGDLTDGRAIRAISETEVIASVGDFIDRTILCPQDSEIIVLEIGAAVAGATLATPLKCLYFHNIGAVSVEIGLIDASDNESAYFIMKTGEMFLLMDGTHVLDDDSAAVSGTLNDIDKVTLQALTATSRVQMVAF